MYKLRGQNWLKIYILMIQKREFLKTLAEIEIVEMKEKHDYLNSDN